MAEGAWRRWQKTPASSSDYLDWDLADSTLKWGAFSAAEVFVLPSHPGELRNRRGRGPGLRSSRVISEKVNIWRQVAKHNTGFINADTAEGTKASLRCWAALTDEERLALRLRATECFHAEFDFNQAARVVLKNIESLAHSTPRYQHKASAAQLDVKQNTVAS